MRRTVLLLSAATLLIACPSDDSTGFSAGLDSTDDEVGTEDDDTTDETGTDDGTETDTTDTTDDTTETDTTDEPMECGNGVVEGAEECDDGNDVDDDGCTNACTLPACGDAVVQEGEECDVGNETAFCDGDCTFAVCGDGYHNVIGEECDDGNSANNDGCVGPCLLAACGDGYINEGVEECDDANVVDTDDCTAACTTAICGDGIVHEDDEECDDANMVDTDACTAMCTASFCGDGVLWEGMETCDDGNMDDNDACPACEPAFCGDGFLYAGVEECDDGNDDDDDFCTNDCNYNGVGTSCLGILNAAPNSADGVYPIDPDGNGPNPIALVYCDMTTDDGGWTLVGSTRTDTFNDEASAYYDDLQTINPAAAHSGIWTGMRPLAAGNADIRFTCMTDPNGNAMDVDLSFYDIIWYGEITTGSDAQSCFSESNGANDDQPTPARRDNVANSFLPAGDQWAAGYLEGEDSCTDTGDFTVDFDDRGMDSNQSDGTDWGEDDSTKKCGQSGINDGAWHIWVREL